MAIVMPKPKPKSKRTQLAHCGVGEPLPRNFRAPKQTLLTIAFAFAFALTASPIRKPNPLSGRRPAARQSYNDAHITEYSALLRSLPPLLFSITKCPNSDILFDLRMHHAVVIFRELSSPNPAQRCQSHRLSLASQTLADLPSHSLCSLRH